MKFIDLNELENSNLLQVDLCIVGSGPVGTSIAKEFAGSTVQVLIIEAGGMRQTLANQALYNVENVGIIRTTPQELVRNRVIGGSSHTWSGRCVSFDEIDFECRPWIPYSGWPITLTEIGPYLERSRKYLGIGPNIYDDRIWIQLGISPPRPQIDPAFLKCQFWQYSKDESNSAEPTRFSTMLAATDAPNVKLLMHANVTQIRTSEDGARVETLELRTLGGRRAEASAKVFVLACGGLENARLLLASNKIAPNGVGNSHDLVGRFLMDHPGCELGSFDPLRSVPIQKRFGCYILNHEGGRNVYVSGLALSPEIQREEQLLNCTGFFEQTVSPDDSWEALKRFVKRGRPGSENRRTVGKDIFAAIGDVSRLLTNAYRRAARHQGPIQRLQRLWLRCLVEQTPNPSSRVTLAQRADALGMPLLRVDWRIGDLERRSVMRLNELIGSELRRAGLPKHSPNYRLDDDIDWRSQFIDRAHPSGTTRMADVPTHGVVDRECRVHAVRNLYIGGSSVFPTAGHGNPTLMVVALAIRLADWLKRHEFAHEHA